MSRLISLLILLVSGPLWPQSIAVISDLNGRYGSTSYHQRVSDAIMMLVELQPDLVISTGDMVAGQHSKLDSDQLDGMWDGFNQTVTNPLDSAHIPFLVTPGNHDGSGFQKFTNERARFESQWQSRVPELKILPGSEWPVRYAARIGQLILIAFDGTRPGKIPQPDSAFVEGILNEYSSPAQTILVFSHLPMWPLAVGRESEILEDPEFLDLLHQHDVDAYISGHHHVFFPGRDSHGMLHIGVGALGGNSRTMVGQSMRQPFSMVILDIDEDDIRVRSLAAPGFSTGVSRLTQPDSVAGPAGELIRLNETVNP